MTKFPHRALSLGWHVSNLQFSLESPLSPISALSWYLQHVDQYLSTKRNIFERVESKSALVSFSLQSRPKILSLFLSLFPNSMCQLLSQFSLKVFGSNLLGKEIEFAISSRKRQSRFCTNLPGKDSQKSPSREFFG